MNNTNEILRSIPQVETILQKTEIENFTKSIGHQITTNIIRDAIIKFRKEILQQKNIDIDSLFSNIITNCKKIEMEKLQRVINGTGVIMHTNLGRSPLSEEILQSLTATLSGYSNLEFHLPTEKRGKRGGFAERLICELTGAEDALIVNNNASSVFLVLKEFAQGNEVIVSRSELIQIGGGFRIPDIMKQTGANLVEVGTTNITTIDDFSGAITENTSMILSAHQSNYKIEGFTKFPTLKEISKLKNEKIIFYRDLGSGNMIKNKELPDFFEPTIIHELSQGSDIISFSGDKLLGGSQAGIIIGKKEYIAKLRKNPLMRMIRVDKITYYILQETLLKYSTEKEKDIKLWNIIFQKQSDIKIRTEKLIKKLDNNITKKIEKFETAATYGGGSLPTMEINSFGIKFKIEKISADKIYSFFINQKIPIVGKITNNFFYIDFISIFDKDIEPLINSINLLFETFNIGVEN